MFYQNICTELKKVSEQIKEIEQKIKQYPKGMLFSRQNGKYHKWYYSTKKKTVYIPKKDRALAEKLLEKKYYSCLLNDSLRKKKALEACVKVYGPDATQVESLLASSKYEELFSGFYKPLSESFHEWMQEEYKQNPYYPEDKIIRGITGNLLRSKSEAMIEQALILQGIPYRYECALQLGNRTHYPDFMILHPVTGQLIIWEHYGLLDNDKYVRKKVVEAQEYLRHGYFPSVNFIATFEDKDHPLDFAIIDRIIEAYLT